MTKDPVAPLSVVGTSRRANNSAQEPDAGKAHSPLRAANAARQAFAPWRRAPSDAPCHGWPIKPSQSHHAGFRLLALAVFLFLGTALFPVRAAGQAGSADSHSQADFLATARKQFQEAHRQFQSGTNRDETAWHFAQACFDLADLTTNNIRRVMIAEEGIAACRQLIARDPDSAPGHYYLGMNLGQVADTKRNLSALRMVGEMEKEFKRSRELDEQFDYAGPDRNLGLLYWQAPVFISVGNRRKAREHLRRAVQLAPDYPENHLNLIEAELNWGNLKVARQELQSLEKLWPKAKKKFTGAAWAPSWADWKKRLQAAKDKLSDAAKPMSSPHNRD